MTDPTISIKNERAIEIPISITPAQVEQVGGFLTESGKEGFALTGIRPLTSGHQRDPYTIGVRLTLTKQ